MATITTPSGQVFTVPDDTVDDYTDQGLHTPGSEEPAPKGKKAKPEKSGDDD